MAFQGVKISQRGLQSRYLVEIAEQRAAGTPMTHILNYKISSQPLNTHHASAIRRALKDAVWEKVITEQVAVIPNMLYPVPITWRMPNAGGSCAYYYTEAGLLFSDEVIQKHAQSLLSRITNQIRAQHPEYGNEWGLAFVVAKVLGTALLAPPQLRELVNENINDEYIDDEEEEEEEE